MQPYTLTLTSKSAEKATDAIWLQQQHTTATSKTVITQMLPCHPYSKECGEGCRCYMIATTAYYCYVENIHNTDAVLQTSLQRVRRRLQMLYDCDDGVLLVRRGAVMTQMWPYTRSLTRALYVYATPRPKYDSPHQPSASAPARTHHR